jgi:hypothetical protein
MDEASDFEGQGPAPRRRLRPRQGTVYDNQCQDTDDELDFEEQGPAPRRRLRPRQGTSYDDQSEDMDMSW